MTLSAHIPRILFLPLDSCMSDCRGYQELACSPGQVPVSLHTRPLQKTGYCQKHIEQRMKCWYI